MRPKFRLLLVPMLASLFLAACDSETNGNNATTDTTTEETTLTTEENTEETETFAVAENTEIEDTITEEAETDENAEETTEDTAEAPVEEETRAEEATSAANSAALEAELQLAVDQLVAESDIDLENYTFLFTETAEYVEIEVLEKIDAENTPLVGTYRYIIETGELLASDYLTGEFVPLEELE